jgi:FkbM family methyltransferase
MFNRSRTNNSDDLSYSGSIKKPKNHLNIWPFIIFDNSVEVKTITLDTYCKNHNIDFIDFIWADIQGAELDMINGGLHMFSNKVKYLYTEYSNDEIYEGQASLNQILAALGSNWRIVHDFKTDILLENFTI